MKNVINYVLTSKVLTREWKRTGFFACIPLQTTDRSIGVILNKKYII